MTKSERQLVLKEFAQDANTLTIAQLKRSLAEKTSSLEDTETKLAQVQQSLEQLTVEHERDGEKLAYLSLQNPELKRNNHSDLPSSLSCFCFSASKHPPWPTYAYADATLSF